MTVENVEAMIRVTLFIVFHYGVYHLYAKLLLSAPEQAYAQKALPVLIIFLLLSMWLSWPFLSHGFSEFTTMLKSLSLPLLFVAAITAPHKDCRKQWQIMLRSTIRILRYALKDLHYFFYVRPRIRYMVDLEKEKKKWDNDLF